MNPKDQIKQTLSILDVVSTYVRLEKAGSQYKGRCPFHNEKSPSFFVSPDRGTYHCFGCSSHGDIFSFVEKMESVPFFEALNILADRAGIKLAPYKKEQKDKETNLISLLQKATIHYKRNLENSPEAKIYLDSRGLNGETIKAFDIGFSLGGENGWRDLFISLSKEGFTPEEMIEAGVVIKKDGEEKYFDRFRGRIIFPIKNTFGNVVGFSARILPKFDDGKMGKYINSPETPIYHKSKILFGYDLAKKSIAEKKEIILVEGQMDMIMSYQAGITNIVATSGTSVTDEHIKILKRFAEKVLLAFDQDEAGEQAMKKCALLSLFGGLDAFVVPKKIGVKDTADLIKEYGGRAWEELLEKRQHIIEYLVANGLLKTKDERERNIRIIKEIAPYWRALEHNTDKDYFLKSLSQKLDISAQAIFDDFKKVKIDTEEKKEEKEYMLQISKKNKILISILAILGWRNIDQDKFIHRFFGEKEDNIPKEEFSLIDFKENFIDNQKELSQEIIEKEIIKIQKETANNNIFNDNEKKFIDNLLSDLVRSYKIELLQEESESIKSRIKKEESEDEIKRLSYIHKEIQNLKNIKI